MFRGYVALLFLGGLAATIIGTFLPQGGGTTLAVIGAAALGASLVLIGMVFLRDRDEAAARSAAKR
jgi:membrane protein implicated in regulation of membrane protease activity